MSRARKTREDRLQEIWQAAKRSFLEKGYESTTTEDIIAKTELSKGGFYHYYSNKKQILMDMMKNGNTMYIKYNEHMKKLNHVLSKEEKKEILLDAIMDKMLIPTEDKKIYTIFLTQMISDSDFWDMYLRLEEEFLTWLADKLEIDIEEKEEKVKLFSRMMNGTLLAQHTFYETGLFIRNKSEFIRLYEPIIDDILTSE